MDIDCLMVGEPIPADLCSAEQGTHHCAGCTASTRRCTACQKARGITDAKRGLCDECAEKNPKASRRNEAVSSLLENFSDRVDDLVGSETKFVEVSLSRSAQAVAISPPILSQPDLIYGMLCEHALEHGDGFIVRGVMQLLAIRARLTKGESDLALSKLVKRGDVEALSDGEIRLLKNLEAIPGIIERRGEEYTPRGYKSRAKKPATAKGSRGMPQSNPLPHPVPPALLPVQSPQAPVALVVMGPSVGDVFRFVQKMSSVFGNERLARAVVPTIGARLKIGPQDTIAALEKLERAGAISRKDGWRSVAILVDSFDDVASVVTPKVTPPALSRMPSASRSESGRGQRERHHLRVVPDVAEMPQSTETPSPPLPSLSLDEAIERLEHALPAIRALRDQTNAKVAMLELTLSQLKSAQGQVAQVERMAKQTLAEAETAMGDLLNVLRQKA